MKKLLLLLAVMTTALTASAEKYITYTSRNGQVVEPARKDGFGASIVSNTYRNGQGEIVFDGEVTAIGEDAFMFCSNLQTIEIPNSVTSIKYGAFTGCTSLSSVVIPNSVNEIGYQTFYQCI